MLRSRAERWVTSASWTETVPTSAVSRPLMMRSSVVLPDPDGPSSASRLPSATSRLTLSSATNEPKRLVRLRTTMLIKKLSAERGVSTPCLPSQGVDTPRSLVSLLSGLAFQGCFDDERDQGQKG